MLLGTREKTLQMCVMCVMCVIRAGCHGGGEPELSDFTRTWMDVGPEAVNPAGRLYER